MYRLNLGAGSTDIEGYINLDAATGDIIFPLGAKEVDVIRASHVLEHFGTLESISVLGNWIDCLKPGGIIKIAVPDFDDLVRRRALGDLPFDFEAIVMGGQTDQYDFHKSIWNYDKLFHIMRGFGLTDIQTWQSEIQDCASYPFSLNLQGRKS